MVKKQFSHIQYLKMWQVIDEFEKKEGRLPNFVDWGGIRIVQAEYLRALEEVQKFIAEKLRTPQIITMNGEVPEPGH